MTAANLPSDRHLHAVPPLPVLPWWCRTFGHHFTQPTVSGLRFPIMCRRCGTRP